MEEIEKEPHIECLEDEDICALCVAGENLVDYETCKFDCPEFDSVEQCRVCPKTCKYAINLAHINCLEDEESICMFCALGEQLEEDEICRFADVQIEYDCPGFDCVEQCRLCPKDCKYYGNNPVTK